MPEMSIAASDEFSPAIYKAPWRRKLDKKSYTRSKIFRKEGICHSVPELGGFTVLVKLRLFQFYMSGLFKALRLEPVVGDNQLPSWLEH